MAVGQQFLLLLVVLFAAVPALTLDTSSCDKVCHEEYSASQSLKVGTCSRGCRFFAIASLIRRNDAAKDILDNCAHSCGLAYDGHMDGSKDVCVFGCEKQSEAAEKKPVTSEREEFIKSLFNMNNFANMLRQRIAQQPQVSINVDVEKKGEEEQRSEPAAVGASSDDDEPKEVSFDTPVMSVRRVVAQVVGQFHILRTSVMTYFKQPDDTLVAVQSNPQVMVEVVPEEGLSSPQDVLKPAEENSVESRDGEQGPFSKLRESLFSQDDGLSNNHVTKVSLSSSRYGYLMHLLLLLGTVSLCLLGISYCLALVRTRRNHKQKAANLTVALQHEPLKLVRPEDLTKLSIMDEEDQQAPPLPNKQDLALEHAKI